MTNTRKFVFSALAGCAFIVVQAQEATITGTTPAGRSVSVRALTPNILRIDNTAKGIPAAPVQSVLPLEEIPGSATVSRTGNTLRTMSGITATIGKQGELTISGPGTGSSIFDYGVRLSADGKSELSIATTGKGSFYGAGERGHSLNLSGDTLVMYNRQNYGYTGNDPRISQMNITMPLILSSEGYALVFDDFAAAELILSNPIKYISESDKPISYYYIGGVRNMAELTESLTELTGRQPLAPLWALGYITSKYGYKTQDETEAVVDSLKTLGYPLDGIVLDLYWYGKEEDMGRLAWDPEQWPEAEKMLQNLREQGIYTVPISQPYVLRNGRAIDNYNELSSKGLFVADSTGGPQEVKIWVGEGGMFDVSNPETRRWLSERYQQLTDMGVGGWWGDLGEPEVHPESGIHANGLTARRYHNHYGNDWSSIISELYAEKYPDTRLLTLMRGGTTGLQRHSVFPWSTDVSRSWGGLEPQIRIMLNSGLSGLGYMSSDLGGFAVDPANPYQPELYLRWVQAGLFSPVFRTHSSQTAEPYHYPMYAEELLQIVKERYRWLPYNYTLAYENAAFGYPLVRPLDFGKSAHGEYDNVWDEYLWGNEVLVAPVITEGSRARNIVFPKGAEWVDYSDPSKIFAGGSTEKDYPAPLDKIPIFVRSGAFIPQASYKMENTSEYRSDEFTVLYYPATDGHSRYTLFDDNHVSPRSIDEGQYRLITFLGERNDKTTEINIIGEGGYAGAPAEIKLSFKVFCLGSAPKEVRINGEKTAINYDAASGCLLIDLIYNPSHDCKIIIKN